ncbi:O-antigen ligase family protein [Devosia honganensis]|uniref:O-antigen ligase family protein n=1 Tax=Devosia honganensis TaxID=1610527 RepID=A0ABV7X3X0_9HYPH
MTVAGLERGAAWLVLAFLLVGANLIGNLSAYAYAVVLLAMLPVLLWDGTMRARMWRPAALLYALAFLLLLLAFALSARQVSDLQYAGNFVFFLLFIPAVALLSSNAGVRASEQFAWLALIGAAAALGVGFYEVHIQGLRRAVGFVNLTNPFAMMSVMLGFLSLIGVFARKDLLRWAFLLGPIFGGGAAILAGTRAAMVMMACLSVLFVLYSAFTLKGRERNIVFAGTALLLLAAIAGTAFFASNLRAFSAFETLARFFGQGEAIDTSTEIRLNLYYGGLRAFLDSPIFGHGWWRHVEAAHPYMTDYVREHTQLWSHLHNDYINFAALAGVMGLASYVIYMSVPVVGAAKAPRDSQYAPRLFGGLVLATCYAVFGLFDVSFSMEILLGFGPICAAALLGFCVDEPPGS